jgi:hypothetical protein
MTKTTTTGIARKSNLQNPKQKTKKVAAKLPQAMDSTAARSVVLIPRMKPSSASF